MVNDYITIHAWTGESSHHCVVRGTVHTVRDDVTTAGDWTKEEEGMLLDCAVYIELFIN